MKKLLSLVLVLCILSLFGCSSIKQGSFEYQGEGFIVSEEDSPSLYWEESPSSSEREGWTESSEDRKLEDVSEVATVGETTTNGLENKSRVKQGTYELIVQNSDGSKVYTCAVPYYEGMATIQDSWDQLYHYSKTEYYTDGIHPGGYYEFTYYHFPLGSGNCVLKTRQSTDETHSWKLVYVSSIEFESGVKINLENSYLKYNGEYSNCIDYQCLNGNQITGGTGEVVKTDYGFCTEFVVIIDGWIQ